MNNLKYNQGISMVELIVVMSIFLILSSITIFNYGQFRSSISIQNLADDIALVIRKAQSYSTGVQVLSNDRSGRFGVMFTINGSYENFIDRPFQGSRKMFILFQDKNSNQAYSYTGDRQNCGTPSSTNECLEAFRIKSNDYIKYIRYKTNNNNFSLTTNEALYISFARPNTEPFFMKGSITHSPPSVSPLNASSVQIIVGSLADPSIEKTIILRSNGQISVSQ
jgi:prepilin-type N-terminal cleavage/methylation domain-containing protein